MRLQSHQKALAAQEKCFLSGEIAAIELGGKIVDKDNGPRAGQSMEQLAKLRPFFDASGTVTAGNSCPITDGGAALVLTGKAGFGSFSETALGIHHALRDRRL